MVAERFIDDCDDELGKINTRGTKLQQPSFFIRMLTLIKA